MERASIFTKLFLGLIIAVVFSSCEEKEEVRGHFYGVDSLIQAQINNLSILKTTLTKRTHLQNKVDTVIITTPDSLLWVTELEAFKQLESVNKPVNKKAYDVTDFLDSKSNLSIRQFSAKEIEMQVQVLRLYYQGDVANLKKIEAHYHKKNYLYENRQQLVLVFDNIYNKNTLINYTIEGTQKMILTDSVTFLINGNIILN